VVHNGIIENHEQLRAEQKQKGYEFTSQTDTEVIVHQIYDYHVGQDLDLLAAVQRAVADFKGAYALGVVSTKEPGRLVVARLGSPLVIGIGVGEHFIASDVAALLPVTQKFIFLNDGDVADVTRDTLSLYDKSGAKVERPVRISELTADSAERGEYRHYMLKEIFEQPDTVLSAMRGRLDRDQATAVFGGLNLTPRQLRRIERIVLTACGTSWHSAMVGEYMIEAFARIPVEVEYASELRYRNPPLSSNTLLFAITQSGETIDTLAALREVKRKGHPTLAICNVVGSTIAREADGGIYLHAGPEIGVASTKAYTSQCVVMALLGLYFGRLRHLSFEAGLRIIDELEALPPLVAQALESNQDARRIAAKYSAANNFLYLGRQYNFPTALEGALKLKEISYIHAEGYPAAEMKHGPIALVDEHTPSVFIVPQGAVYHKVIANMEEVKARGGPVIAIVDEGDSEATEIADDVIRVPAVADFLQPIVTVIPLQLLAYHAAILRGCDVDKPRNLAKSVTVE
jgi:glucosamine--fructose-6-phosphate aminotransferase (isomerizing)